MFDPDAAAVGLHGKVREFLPMQPGDRRLIAVVVGRTNQLAGKPADGDGSEDTSRRIALHLDSAVEFAENV